MVMETLTCSTCSQTFQRERVRGRKPKHCPQCRETEQVRAPRERIYKSESGTVDFEPQVVDISSGERDASKIEYPEIEIPDEAKETVVTKWLKKYDQIIVDGKLFAAGDSVKIHKDSAGYGKYQIMCFAVNTSGHMYFELIGTSGSYAGKYRFIDPWRIRK